MLAEWLNSTGHSVFFCIVTVTTQENGASEGAQQKIFHDKRFPLDPRFRPEVGSLFVNQGKFELFVHVPALSVVFKQSDFVSDERGMKWLMFHFAPQDFELVLPKVSECERYVWVKWSVLIVGIEKVQSHFTELE